MPKLQAKWFKDIQTRELYETIIGIAPDTDYLTADTLKTRLSSDKRNDLINRLNYIMKQEFIYPGDLHEQLAKEYNTAKIESLTQHLRHQDSTMDSKIAKINQVYKELSADADERRVFKLAELCDEYVDAKEKGIPNRLMERSIDLKNQTLINIFGKSIMPAVYGIGARPGFRKTDLLINLLVDFESSKKNGVFVSFEDNRETLRNKFLAIKNRVAKKKINEYNLEEHQFEDIKKNRPKSQIFIIERRCNIETLRYRLDALLKTHSIDFILMDYIQLFKFGRGKRHEEMGQVTKEFMDIANTNLVPIMFCSQVNNRDEGEDGKISLDLGDFKESGDIEADVRHAVLIQGTRAGAQKIMHIAKNTWGPVFKMGVSFDEESGYLRSTDW